VIRPPHIGAFEFVVLASLRTAQLTRGCTPRVPPEHKHIVTAQREIAAGLVTNAPAPGIREVPPLESDEPTDVAAADTLGSRGRR
jgi:DNA-directed RNA polymerase subunit K/omega